MAVVGLQFAGLCTCTRVLLTGWQAAHCARAALRAGYPGAGGTTVVSGSCSGELRCCKCIRRLYAYAGVPCVRKADGSAHRRCRLQRWSTARGWRLGWRCPSRRGSSSRAYKARTGDQRQSHLNVCLGWRGGGIEQRIFAKAQVFLSTAGRRHRLLVSEHEELFVPPVLHFFGETRDGGRRSSRSRRAPSSISGASYN